MNRVLIVCGRRLLARRPFQYAITGGASDFTVFRDSAGAWYTQFAAGGTSTVGWGISGDKPVGRRPGS